MASPLSPITKNKLLLVEGKDEVNFFEVYISKLNIYDIEVRDVGGVEQFHTQFPLLLKVSGFNLVKSIGIIRDADTSYASAFASINSVLSKNGFGPITATNTRFSFKNIDFNVFILPDNKNNGCLEDNLINLVNTSPNYACVINFISCISSSALQPKQKNLSKAKIQAFLASMPEPVYCVGIGTQKSYFDLTSTSLSDIKNFILSL